MAVLDRKWPQKQSQSMYLQKNFFQGRAVADPGGVKGVQMHPPFEGLPLRVLSKSAQM